MILVNFLTDVSNKTVQEYYAASYVKELSNKTKQDFYNTIQQKNMIGRFKQELGFLRYIDRYDYYKLFMEPLLSDWMSNQGRIDEILAIADQMTLNIGHMGHIDSSADGNGGFCDKPVEVITAFIQALTLVEDEIVQAKEAAARTGGGARWMVPLSKTLRAKASAREARAELREDRTTKCKLDLVNQQKVWKGFGCTVQGYKEVIEDLHNHIFHLIEKDESTQDLDDFFKDIA